MQASHNDRIARMRRNGLLAILALLASCATPVPPQVPAENPQAPAEFPQAYYRQAEASGKKILRVNPALSLVSIEVRRAGRLARLGHDHLVASHEVQGFVAPQVGRADLYLPLATLTVDEAALRAEAGFDTQPSGEAIEGTRNNMLGKVLDPSRFPFVLIHASGVNAAQSSLSVSITLQGVTRTFEVPARIETHTNGIAVSGSLSFNQSDFGIQPFSILGGAIQVRDRLDLRFRIVADQAGD